MSDTSKGTTSSTITTASTNSSNDDNTCELVSDSGNTSDQYNSSETASTVVVPDSLHDRERLGEFLPFVSVEAIDNALSQYGSIDMAADALVQESSIPEHEEKLQDIYPSLGEIIKNVRKKLTGRKEKLEVDPDDIISDAISYYKSIDFDPYCPLRIAYKSQPAVDSGGVMRQFYSDLFEGLAEGKLMVLFEGEADRKVPSYRPVTVMSGLLEMVGKMISHSIAQGGPGFPFLAIPCYYYLVTGDVMCAMAYSDAWDIPDPFVRNVVLQVCDVLFCTKIKSYK